MYNSRTRKLSSLCDCVSAPPTEPTQITFIWLPFKLFQSSKVHYARAQTIPYVTLPYIERNNVWSLPYNVER